jgi:hypothetical protein
MASGEATSAGFAAGGAGAAGDEPAWFEVSDFLLSCAFNRGTATRTSANTTAVVNFQLNM